MKAAGGRRGAARRHNTIVFTIAQPPWHKCVHRRDRRDGRDGRDVTEEAVHSFHCAPRPRSRNRVRVDRMSSARCIITRAARAFHSTLSYEYCAVTMRQAYEWSAGRSRVPKCVERKRRAAPRRATPPAQSRAQSGAERLPPRQFSISAHVACCSTRLDSERRPACFGLECSSLQFEWPAPRRTIGAPCSALVTVDDHSE